MDTPAQTTDTTAKKTTRSGTARATTSARGTRNPKPSDAKTVSNGVETKKTVAKKAATKKAAERKPPARKAAAKKIAEPASVEPRDEGLKADQEVADEQHGAAPAGDELPESTIESVRAYETPIFAAMFSGWDGPAAGMIGRNLQRADDDTMVFDTLMWRPRPDSKAPALRFYVSGDRHAPVITVTGELKPGSVALLTTPLRHILRRRPRQLIVDLAGITAASPAALRALLDVRQAARVVHVDFWLRSPSEPVQKLLQQVAVRSKTSAVRRLSGSMKQRDTVGDAAIIGRDQDSVAEPASQAEPHVLEGVVVQGPATRARPWWSSHALRESLRRVGTHQHSHAHTHGHGSPT